MTDEKNRAAEELLRTAGVNPSPRPPLRRYLPTYGIGTGRIGMALFVNGRMRGWYFPDLLNEGLYDVVENTGQHRREKVEGEDVAAELLYQWAEDEK